MKNIDVKMMSRANVLALLGSAAAGGALSMPARAQDNQTLRIGVVAVDNSMEIHYANDLGYFTNAGLSVEITEASTSTTLIAGIVGGSLDIVYTTIDTIASGHVHGIPLVAVGPAGDYLNTQGQNYTGLLVRSDSSIRTAKDLNGKTISVSGLHGLGTTATSAWIDQNGGDSTTVKYVEIPFPAAPAALDQGRVDAIDEVVPYFKASKTSRVLMAGYDSIAKHFQATLWVAKRDWAEANPILIRRFAAVIRRAAIWANSHHAESAAMLAKYSKMPPEVIATLVRAHYAEDLTTSLMQPGIDASAKYNSFKSFPATELLVSK